MGGIMVADLDSAFKLSPGFDLLVGNAGRASSAHVLALLHRQPACVKLIIVGDFERLAPYCGTNEWCEMPLWSAALSTAVATGGLTVTLLANYRCPTKRMLKLGRRRYGITFRSGPDVVEGHRVLSFRN